MYNMKYNISLISQRAKGGFALLLFLLTTLSSFAQNITVSIDDFEIAPGEQKTVNINVTNDVAWGTDFGGDIYLPDGLVPVANDEGDYLERNMTRCTTSHGLTSNYYKNESYIRFALSSQTGKTLKGNEGAVLSFTVEATEELAESSTISLKEAFIMNTSANKVVADCEAKVKNSSYVRPTLTTEGFSLTPSKEYTLSFSFNTATPVSAFEAHITLPEGLEPVLNEDEEYASFNMSRLTSSHTPASTFVGRTVNVMVSSSKSSNLKGEDGELFSITLRATGGLSEEAVIAVTPVIASTSAGTRIDIDGIEVKVSNPDIAAKATADEKISGLKNAFDEVKEAISALAESVQAMFQADIETVNGKVVAIEEALALDVTNGEVAANAETRDANIEEAKGLIASLKENAAKAQEDYNANEAQHTADLAAIAEVKVALEAAKAKVAEYAESVQAAFAETVAGIEAAVERLAATAEASYNNGTSVADAEALNEASAAVVADIEKLLADAAAAQQAYEEEVAKNEANEAQHTADLAAIAEVKVALEAAKAKVAEYAESVQAAFAETVAGIEAAVERLSDTAEASYNNGTSVADAEALNEASATVVADIEKLLAAAAAAQQAYEEEVAKDKANEAQHTADLAAIAEVKVALEAAKAKVAEYAESVQAAVAEDIEAVEEAVAILEAQAEASYAAGTSVADAEELAEAVAAVQMQIAEILVKAEEAQQNVTKPGDINESGTVDIDDLTFIRDLALAKIDKESLTEKQKEAADLNGDGKFTVSDLVILNNIIIYGNPDGPVSKAKGSTTVMNAGTLAMYLSANRMNLTLDSKMAYAAIQMDVTMPYGVGLDEISFAGVSENVIVATNTLDNGTCRIIMYTSDNSAIMSEDSSLLNIVLTGEGRGIVNIDNIIAAAANGKSYNLSAISGSHTIVTGISSIEINGEKGCYVYDANGVASKTLKKGVNIVRNSAGDVKKVFVK